MTSDGYRSCQMFKKIKVISNQINSLKMSGAIKAPNDFKKSRIIKYIVLLGNVVIGIQGKESIK